MRRFTRSLLLAALMLVPLVGCSDRLLRESVLASTQSTIGLAIGENPRTGLYEGSLGYARGELFLVPTGKRIVNSAGEQVAGADGTLERLSTNDADITPEVLGEILADGAFVAGPLAPGAPAQPLRVGVYQRLAVGKLAVSTPAAVALMARDPHAADAAAGALQDRTLDELAAESVPVRFTLTDTPGGAALVPWDAAADAWSRELGFKDYDTLYASGSAAAQRALAQRWAAELHLARLRAHALPYGASARPAR
ncbi:MAG: hypothetical protein ACKVS8_05130 [Phycisphaerales bacterium]